MKNAFCGIHNVAGCSCPEPKPGDCIRLKGGRDEFDVRMTFTSHLGAPMLIAVPAGGSGELRACTSDVELVPDALNGDDVVAALQVGTSEVAENVFRIDFAFVARALRDYINDGRDFELPLTWLDEAYARALVGDGECWDEADSMAKTVSRDLRQRS